MACHMKFEKTLEARRQWGNTSKSQGENDFQTRFLYPAELLKQEWAQNIDIFNPMTVKYFMFHAPFLLKYRSKWNNEREFKCERAHE